MVNSSIRVGQDDVCEQNHLFIISPWLVGWNQISLKDSVGAGSFLSKSKIRGMI